MSVSFWHVSILAEQYSLRELFGALNKNIAVGFRSEEVEAVFIKYRVFWFVSAINKLLMNFPTNGTHVSVLAQWLFYQASIIVQILKNTWSVVEIKVSGELETCLSNFF